MKCETPSLLSFAPPVSSSTSTLPRSCHSAGLFVRDTFPLTDRSRLDIFPCGAPGFSWLRGQTNETARIASERLARARTLPNAMCGRSHTQTCADRGRPIVSIAAAVIHLREQAVGARRAARGARETSRRINILFRFPLRKRLKHAIYLFYFRIRGMFFGRTSKASRAHRV